MIRGQIRILDKAFLGPLQHDEGVGTSNRFPCSISEEGKWFLIWDEGRGHAQRLGRRGDLGGLHTSLVVLSAGLCTVPCLSSQLFRNGNWTSLAFVYLLSIICPNCLCMQLFFVPYNFVFCCSRRFVQMLALQQRVLGPGVSAGLFSCALRHVTSSSFRISTSSWWLWSGHTLFYVRANGQVCQCQHVCTEHVCSAPLLEILLSAMRTVGPPYSAIFRKKKHR